MTGARSAPVAPVHTVPLDAKTTAAVCYLVESWQAGLSNVKGYRILNVYTNLESVRLEINGVATPHDPVTVGPYDAADTTSMVMGV